MPTMRGDVVAASQLLAYGLRPKQEPARLMEYQDLVDRYCTDADFQDVVEQVADGFDVRVLMVSRKTGIVMAPRYESPFAVRMSDYASTGRDGTAGINKLIHGLAHMAIATYAFPRPEDLADPDFVGQVRPDEVEALLREACAALERKAAEADANNDPLEDARDLELAWRSYSRAPKVVNTKDGREGPTTTVGMVKRAVRWLEGQGLLRQIGKTDTWATRPRYQVLVRDAGAMDAFTMLLDYGVVAHPDEQGRLHVARAIEDPQDTGALFGADSGSEQAPDTRATGSAAASDDAATPST